MPPNMHNRGRALTLFSPRCHQCIAPVQCVGLIDCVISVFFLTTVRGDFYRRQWRHWRYRNRQWWAFLPRDAIPARGIRCRRVSDRLSVCLSVRPSVTSRYCIETTGRIELFLVGMLPSIYPTLCCKEIWVSQKLGYFPLELCAKLRTWKISPWQVDRVVS